VVYDGDKDRRRYLRETFIKPGHFNIVMTTFEFAMRDKTILRKIPWAYIIIDESVHHTCGGDQHDKWRTTG